MYRPDDEKTAYSPRPKSLCGKHIWRKKMLNGSYTPPFFDKKMLQTEKNAIFDALATHDIALVVMDFSGGHDEGSADGWAFYDSHGNVEYAAPAALLADHKNILEDMEEILLARFHYFNNQPSAWGEVEWDVVKRKVYLRAEQEVCSTEKIDSEL